MKTLADHSRAYRQRKAERLARLEGALRHVVAMADEYEPDSDDDWSNGYAAGLDNAAMHARNALARARGEVA